MSFFSDTFKVLYLVLSIVFFLGVFAYLLDSWQVINLEHYLPMLQEEAPLVEAELDSQELEWEKLRKEEARIEEERLELEEALGALKLAEEHIEKKRAALDKRLDSFQKEKEAFARAKKAHLKKQKLAEDTAERLQSMPPEDAVEILESLHNTELISVFLAMERKAQREGQASIVPYLLSLMPSKRAALIMSLMMDEKASLEEPK